MNLHRYTQAEFDALPVVDGIRQCPTGDYSAITRFKGCSFGARCSFGEGCSFGEWCDFGAGCSFGERCSFGARCSFGERCDFGAGCSFGERCSFCEGCSFGKGCSFEGGHLAMPGNPYIAIDRAGSVHRKTYFFHFTDGIYVRAGCFFGTLAEFRAKVLQDCAPDSLKARQYLGFADIAELTFREAA